MQIKTARSRAEFVIDGATFYYSPPTMQDKLRVIFVRGDIARRGFANIDMLSDEAREALAKLVDNLLTDWKGIRDEHGRDVPFATGAAGRYLEGDVLLTVGLKIVEAMVVSDREEKNSSTALKLADSAPVTSTAESVSSSAPIPAVSLVSSAT